MTMISFIILALATSRASSLVAYDHGPWDVMDKIRHLIGVRFDEQSRPFGSNEFARMALCIWCNSIWIALVLLVLLALLPSYWWFLVAPLAMSEVAIMGERLWKK
jgi:hypothetical protein